MTVIELMALLKLVQPLAAELAPEFFKMYGSLVGPNDQIDRVRFEADFVYNMNIAADKLIKEHGYDPAALRAIVNTSK